MTEIADILKQLPLVSPVTYETIKNQEDGSDYAVWKVTCAQKNYILKRTNLQEADVYKTFFQQKELGVPKIYSTLKTENDIYLLMEYMEGNDLRKCNRDAIIKVLDALIQIQDLYWENSDLAQACYHAEKGFASCQKRGTYLKDSQIQSAYQQFLLLYSSVPKTLCHADLLPFNVIANEDKAAIIDWEYAGILPYPISLARLIAHGEEDENAFFYMTEADRQFAISYYYENLIKKKGISYANYRATLDYFLLHEYCEWIMVGEKYQDTDSERYRSYCLKAKAHISNLCPVPFA